MVTGTAGTGKPPSLRQDLQRASGAAPRPPPLVLKANTSGTFPELPPPAIPIVFRLHLHEMGGYGRKAKYIPSRQVSVLLPFLISSIAATVRFFDSPRGPNCRAEDRRTVDCSLIRRTRNQPRFASWERAKREITEHIDTLSNRIRGRVRLGDRSPTCISRQTCAQELAA